MRKISIILSIALLAVSCGPQGAEWNNAIPFVRDIAVNSSNPWRSLLAEVTEPTPDGDICIIGGEASCLALAEKLATVDHRDNVDGSYNPDGLPDFAGETITCMVDTLGLSHSMIDAIRAGYLDRVGETAVKYVLSTIDTVCHITLYDVDGIGSKNRAKLVILADPEFTVAGKSSVDTLFSAFDVRVRVLSPLEEMKKIVAQSEGTDRNIGILCRPDYEGKDLYTGYFKGSTVLPAGQDSTLVNMMDRYIEGGNTRAFDNILCDDYAADVESIKNEIAQMISLMNEESLVYGKYFSKDFRFLDSSDVLAASCYDILRKDNTFTHNISKPKITVYYAHPDPDGRDDCFFVPGTYVQD